jgi:hypothetical protein
LASSIFPAAYMNLIFRQALYDGSKKNATVIDRRYNFSFFAMSFAK